MTGYIIKRADGKVLCWHFIAGYYFDHFNIRSLINFEIGTETEMKIVLRNNEFDNKDCKVTKVEIKEVEE